MTCLWHQRIGSKHSGKFEHEKLIAFTPQFLPHSDILYNNARATQSMYEVKRPEMPLSNVRFTPHTRDSQPPGYPLGLLLKGLTVGHPCDWNLDARKEVVKRFLPVSVTVFLKLCHHRLGCCLNDRHYSSSVSVSVSVSLSLSTSPSVSLPLESSAVLFFFGASPPLRARI